MESGSLPPFQGGQSGLLKQPPAAGQFSKTQKRRFRRPPGASFAVFSLFALPETPPKRIFRPPRSAVFQKILHDKRRIGRPPQDSSPKRRKGASHRPPGASFAILSLLRAARSAAEEDLPPAALGCFSKNITRQAANWPPAAGQFSKAQKRRFRRPPGAPFAVFLPFRAAESVIQRKISVPAARFQLFSNLFSKKQCAFQACL